MFRKSEGQLCCRMFLIPSISDVSPEMRVGLCVLGRNLQTCGCVFSGCNAGKQRRRSVSLREVVDFDHSGTVLSARLLHYKVAISLLQFTCVSWGDALRPGKHSPFLRLPPERIISNPHVSDANTDAWRDEVTCPGQDAQQELELKVLTLDLTSMSSLLMAGQCQLLKPPLGYQRLPAPQPFPFSPPLGPSGGFSEPSPRCFLTSC